MKYHRIVAVNQANINKEFMRLVNKITELEEKIYGLESAEVSAFNWLDCDDKDALETFAIENGLDIDKRKSIDNIKKEIAEFLGVAE